MTPERYNNHFLIISKDDKTAELITIPWGQVEKYSSVVAENIRYDIFAVTDMIIYIIADGSVSTRI